MQNGYFRLVKDDLGTGIELFPPQGQAEGIRMGELCDYLDGRGIVYDRRQIDILLQDNRNTVYHLGDFECPAVPETYSISVSEDKMSATVRFFSPSSTGERITYEDFLRDIRFQNISNGIQTEELQQHFLSEGIFCTDIMLAKGKEAVAGIDAQVEYMFETDPHKRPEQKPDGSVDYFRLTTINQCKKGQVLARIIPEKPGVDGYDIYGSMTKAKTPKAAVLKFGRNIALSEDRRAITSMVDGHVTLVDGKVFVSDVFEVKDVNVASGNLEFEGSIQVNGDVAENFEVKAGGNVIINGLVEGARVIAGGNIIISKGMNGMSKGFLRAGGDIVVRYLENTRVVAGGYVHTEAILHSKVSSGNEVTVEGRKGVIVGGYVQASKRITAKSIGANLGASTILEVGVNPLIKTQYSRVQKAILEDTKTIQNAQVIIENFREKLKKGVQYNETQLKYIKTVTTLVVTKQEEVKKMNERLLRIRKLMETQKQAEIVVNDEIFPGTTIIIGDASKTIQSNYHYCKFMRKQGEVTMVPF